MLKAIVCDFFRVILLPQNEVQPTQTSESPILENFIINHQLIDFISQQNQLTTAIFSNSDSLLKMPIIKNKLNDHFDYIFSAKKLKISKSSPAGFILVAKKWTFSQ